MEGIMVLFALVLGAVVLFWITVAVLALLRWRRKRLRRIEMQAVAGELGWSFADRHDLATVPFALRAKGDGSGVANFLTGGRDGRAVTAFDAWFHTNVTDNRMPLRRYRRFTCVATRVDHDWPHLTIEPETRSSRLMDRTGLLADVQFESEEFNRTFEVNTAATLNIDMAKVARVGFGGLKGFKTGFEMLRDGAKQVRSKKDRDRFAHALIDPRMMTWLLEVGPGYRFEVLGSHVLCYTEQTRDVAGLADVLLGFRDKIPRVVPELFPSPVAPEPAPTEAAPATPVEAVPSAAFAAGDPRALIRPEELPLAPDDPRIATLAEVLPPDQLKLLLG